MLLVVSRGGVRSKQYLYSRVCTLSITWESIKTFGEVEMKLHQMQYPLPTTSARCMGTNCNQKNLCQRYLTIEIDTQNYVWHMDVKKEIDDDEICDFFIEFGGM